jgi:hypothetical protein
LNTDYTFANYNCASQFITDMGPVCENEKVCHSPPSPPTLSVAIYHSTIRRNLYSTTILNDQRSPSSSTHTPHSVHDGTKNQPMNSRAAFPV